MQSSLRENEGHSCRLKGAFKVEYSPDKREGTARRGPENDSMFITLPCTPPRRFGNCRKEPNEKDSSLATNNTVLSPLLHYWTTSSSVYICCFIICCRPGCDSSRRNCIFEQTWIVIIAFCDSYDCGTWIETWLNVLMELVVLRFGVFLHLVH